MILCTYRYIYIYVCNIETMHIKYDITDKDNTKTAGDDMTR